MSILPLLIRHKTCERVLIMKDNPTIGNNPENVTRWCRIAREEAERAEARP